MTRAPENLPAREDNATIVPSATASRLRFVITAMVVTLAIVVTVRTPAVAHAQLERTTPAGNERVTATLPSIVFRYSENVTPVDGSLRLTGPGVVSRTLAPLGTGPAPSVEAAPGPLANGAYVAQVEVVSEDGHHVSTAMTFTVEGSGVAATTTVATTTTVAVKTTKPTKPTTTTKRKAGTTAIAVPTTIAAAVAKPADVAVIGDGITGTVRLIPTGRPYRYRVDVTARTTRNGGGTLGNLTLRMAVPDRMIPPIDVPLVATTGTNASATDVVIPALGAFELSIGGTVGLFDAYVGTGTFRLG